MAVQGNDIWVNYHISLQTYSWWANGTMIAFQGDNSHTAACNAAIAGQAQLIQFMGPSVHVRSYTDDANTMFTGLFQNSTRAYYNRGSDPNLVYQPFYTRAQNRSDAQHAHDFATALLALRAQHGGLGQVSYTTLCEELY